MKPSALNKPLAEEAPLFPVFFNLTKKPCIIIGGGNVAQRKAAALIECGAMIKVVSPSAEDKIRLWASNRLLTWHEKKFTDDDLDGVFIAFAATDNIDENRKVTEACSRKSIMVNVVTGPEQSDFTVPSVLRRKALCIAISTSGKSPLFAKRLRSELEKIVTQEYGEFLEMLGAQREIIKQSVPDLSQRAKIFKALVYSDVLELLKAGKREKAKERIEQCMSFLSG